MVGNPGCLESGLGNGWAVGVGDDVLPCGDVAGRLDVVDGLGFFDCAFDGVAPRACWLANGAY